MSNFHGVGAKRSRGASIRDDFMNSSLRHCPLMDCNALPSGLDGATHRQMLDQHVLDDGEHTGAVPGA